MIVSKPILFRSKKIFKLPDRLKDDKVIINCSSIKYPIQFVLVCVNSCNLSLEYICLMNSLNKIKEPEYVNEALCDPNWKLAMDKEMDALRNSKT